MALATAVGALVADLLKIARRLFPRLEWPGPRVFSPANFFFELRTVPFLPPLDEAAPPPPPRQGPRRVDLEMEIQKG